MKKITAATLTEVLVALIIITVITALFFNLIIKVGNYHQNRLKLLAHQAIIEVLDESKMYYIFENEEITYNNFYVQKTCTPFKDIPSVWQIELVAYKNANKQLVKHVAIIDQNSPMHD